MGAAPAWAVVVGLGCYLLAVAWATAPSSYAPLDLALLVVLYGLLAGTLAFGSIGLLRVWRPLGGLASLVAGALLVWHFREQAQVPEGAAEFAAASGLAALLLLAAVWRQAPGPAAAPLRGFAVSAALLAAATAAVFHASPTLRWHLLRHNKLLGTPAYYALSEPVGELRSKLWQGAEEGLVVEPPAPLADSDAKSPHLVFLLVDTLRADALSAYGASTSLMPLLDGFAEESVVFGDVLANATWTRPSVASFFTGLVPEEHGAVDRPFRLGDDHVTLAERLRARGYATAAFVSNFAAVGSDAGFAQGFRAFEELKREGLPYARAEHVNADVLRWLDARAPDDAPLFLYVHYLDPHTPYLSGGAGAWRRWERARSAYDRELRYTDTHVALLIEALRARLDGPLHVFLTSDHGEEFGEHGEMGHGHSLYAEVLRLPALLWTRGGTPGRVDARLEARDFFALFDRLGRGERLDSLAWAGARERSLRYASIYSTTPSSPHRPYLEEVCMRGLEDDDFTLIWSGYGPSLELYAREEDPAQRRNLARNHPKRARALEEALEVIPERWTERLRVEHREDTVDLLRRLGYVE